MADHKKTITLTDLQQKILSNDLYNDTDNAGLDAWLDDAITGKINNCWKRMRTEWTTRLMDDESFTDEDGDTWFKADEYGDKSYMWEYLS